MPYPKKVTNEEIIAAYRDTGSVWKAAAKLGVAGQSVWERLRAIGYPMASRRWTVEEVDHLRGMVGNLSIGEMAKRLGRPYAGVAGKLYELGISAGPGPRQRKIPKGAGLDKRSVKKHMRALVEDSDGFTRYSRRAGLDPDLLAKAIQRVDLDWWLSYVRTQSDLPERACEYCAARFIPFNARQRFCTRKCSEEQRQDQSYFGGKRRNTIGLAEKRCQLCAREGVKGLSSHHIYGKENDPENEFLIALCSGCHQIVGKLSARAFLDESAGWESLISLVMMRRKQSRGTYVCVEIEELSDEEIDEVYGSPARAEVEVTPL